LAAVYEFEVGKRESARHVPALAPLHLAVPRELALGQFLVHTVTTLAKRAKVDRVSPWAILAFYKNTKPSKTVTAFS
jgi:hypothetical protein